MLFIQLKLFTILMKEKILNVFVAVPRRNTEISNDSVYLFIFIFMGWLQVALYCFKWENDDESRTTTTQMTKFDDGQIHFVHFIDLLLKWNDEETQSKDENLKFYSIEWKTSLSNAVFCTIIIIHNRSLTLCMFCGASDKEGWKKKKKKNNQISDKVWRDDFLESYIYLNDINIYKTNRIFNSHVTINSTYLFISIYIYIYCRNKVNQFLDMKCSMLMATNEIQIPSGIYVQVCKTNFIDVLLLEQRTCTRFTIHIASQ